MNNISRPILLLAALAALGVGGPVAATAFASDPTPTPVTTNGATGEQDAADNDLATQVDDENTNQDEQAVDEQAVDEQDDNDLATQVDTGNKDEDQQGENGDDETTATAPTGGGNTQGND
jgi:hypothetical protein